MATNASATLSFGGLATGMDTNSIIDKLVQIQSYPLTRLQAQQAAFRSQVSLLADLASKLEDLRSAASTLSTSGVTALQTTSSNGSFSAVPGTGAYAGSYSVQVKALASAAKWRSGPFAADQALTPGTLRLMVGGKIHPPTDTPAPDGTPLITVDDSTTLGSLAAAIRATGAPVSVSVLDDGTSRYLSITNLATGYSGAQDDALAIDFQKKDAAASESFFSTPSLDAKAENAVFDVDSLTFTRPGNTVSDAIPGTTLTLKSGGGAAETLSIGTDGAATQANLRKFVDAFDAIYSALQKQMNVGTSTDRTQTLAGDSNVRQLQQELQSLTTATLTGTGALRALTDLGVTTNRDGTLSLDTGKLSSAVTADPDGVNALFSTASTGMSSRLSALAARYSSITGILSQEQSQLTNRVGALDDQATQLQSRIDAYRRQLVAQYAAMENLVSSYKSLGDYLTSQDNAANRK